MNIKTKLSALLFFSLGLSTSHAQQATTVSGGNASGSGGSAAYSIGQVVYTTNTGSSGSVSQGVQQPYEISVVTGLDDSDIQLNLSVYPNPTSEFLKLQVENIGSENMMYQLYDVSGKLVESKQVTGNVTNIVMEQLATATYFLKLTQNNKEIKTFKIIKN